MREYAIIKSRNISRDTIARDSEYTHKNTRAWLWYSYARIIFIFTYERGESDEHSDTERNAERNAE